jgi:hypothetical protein
MNRDPQVTLDLFNQLWHRGFRDNAFERLHHFIQRGRAARITSHRRYCERIRDRSGFFATDSNPRVQQRLRWVLDAYQQGNSTPQDFPALAAHAVTVIPF